MTESEGIKKAFIGLRKFGFTVFNFNNHKANNAGTKGHPDWVIITKRYVVYVEVKIGKDQLSEVQTKVVNQLAKLMGMPSSRIYVEIIKTAKEAENLSDRVLSNEL